MPPARYHSPAFIADIAGDSGTDPRSLAWGLWTVTPNGFYFHNWIYQTNAITATDDFASDYGPAHGLNNPIIVDINQGSHSFTIDGVYAQSDPSAGGTVDAIDTWDPGYAGPGTSYNSSQQEVWSVYDWTTYQVPSGSYLFAQPYSNTANGGYDPEPSTNPGYYNPEQGGVLHHWNTYYVTIEQDLVTRCNASPNIAYTQTGAEAPHNGSAYCP